MNNKFLLGVLRDEAGDGGEGGGAGGDVGGDAGEAHLSDAQLLFDGGTGDGGGDAADKGAKKTGETGDAGDAGDNGAKKTGDAPPQKSTLLGKLGKKGGKPDGDKGGAGEAGELPEDKITLGDKAAPETTKHFASLKGITKQLRTDLSARDTRIKDLEAKVAGGTALPADYEQLRAEHKAFSDRLAVVDLQSHPDFVKQFTEPKGKLVAQANTILSDNKVEGVDIASMLHKPRADFMKAVSETAEKLPDYERFEFLASARQLYQLSQAEREALGKSSELSKNLQAKTLSAQRDAFGKTWEKLGGMGEFLLKLEPEENASADEKAAIAAYNKAVDDVKTGAEKVAFNPDGEEGVARAAIKAASFDFFMQHAIPRMEAEYTSLVSLVTQLQTEVKELRGAKGEAGGGGGDGGDGGTADEPGDHLADARKVFRT